MIVFSLLVWLGRCLALWYHCFLGLRNGLFRVFPLPSRPETILPCVFTAGVARTLSCLVVPLLSWAKKRPFPCVSTAFAAQKLSCLVCSSAFVAKTLPFPAVPREPSTVAAVVVGLVPALLLASRSRSQTERRKGSLLQLLCTVRCCFAGTGHDCHGVQDSQQCLCSSEMRAPDAPCATW